MTQSIELPQDPAKNFDFGLATQERQLPFMWLEITGKCQLECEHCYAESSPQGTHGSMSVDDWQRVIREAGELGAKQVQFIGGEPTLHPDLPQLIDYALTNKVGVEVYSNLVHIREGLWDTLAQDGVSIATSYYSDNAAEHNGITKGRRSHTRTEANIAQVVDRGIPLRTGVIAMREGQRVGEAGARLVELGVSSDKIKTDYLRQVGRGERDQKQSIEQLCGKCTLNLAVGPEGQVWPCIFSRWLTVGNVQEQSLESILSGGPLQETRETLNASFAVRQIKKMACPPDCNPYCAPEDNTCVPDCPPRNNPCVPDAPQPCDPQNCGPAH